MAGASFSLFFLPSSDHSSLHSFLHIFLCVVYAHVVGTCICVCVHVYMCAHMCRNPCTHMLRPEVDTGIEYLPLSLSTLVTETGSFTEPEAYPLARLADQKAPRICLSPPPRHWQCVPLHPLLYVSGLHTCIAHTLHTEPNETHFFTQQHSCHCPPPPPQEAASLSVAFAVSMVDDLTVAKARWS